MLPKAVILVLMIIVTYLSVFVLVKQFPENFSNIRRMIGGIVPSLSEAPKITIQGNHFYVNGEKFELRAVHYNQPSAYYSYFWYDLNETMIEEDFRSIKVQGFNAVTVRVGWGDFVTHVDLATKTYSINYTNKEKLLNLVEKAKSHGLYVMVWFSYSRLPEGIGAKKIAASTDGCGIPKGEYYGSILPCIQANSTTNGPVWQLLLEHYKDLADWLKDKDNIIWDPLGWERLVLNVWSYGDDCELQQWRNYLQKNNSDIIHWNERWNETNTWGTVLFPIDDYVKGYATATPTSQLGIVYKNVSVTHSKNKWYDFRIYQNQILINNTRDITAAIKSVDTDAIIGQRIDRWRYNDWRNETWGGDYVDFIFETYNPVDKDKEVIDSNTIVGNITERISRVREELKRKNKSLPIYLSDCQLSTAEFTEQQQKDFFTIAYNAVHTNEQLNLAGMGIWQWRENCGVTSADQSFGLMDRNGVAKPALVELVNLFGGSFTTTTTTSTSSTTSTSTATTTTLSTTTSLTTSSISANPTHLILFPNTRGLTVISWNVEGASGQVWVSMDNNPEVAFASGGAGNQDAFWIVCPHNYTFSLYSGTTHTTKLSSVLVDSSCKKEEFLLGLNQVGGHTDYQSGLYYKAVTPWNLTDQDLATLKQDLHINSILLFIHPRFLGLNQLTWNGPESIDYTKFKDSDYVWYRPSPEIDSFDEVIEQLNKFDITPVFRIFPVGEYLHYINRGDITFLNNQSNMYGPYQNPLNYTGIVPVEQMKNLSVAVAKHMYEKFGDNFTIVYMEICHTGDKCSIREVNESSKWYEVVKAIKTVAPGSLVFSPEIIPWNGYQRNKILNAVPPYTGTCKYDPSFYACGDEWVRCDKIENYAKVFDYPAFSFYPPGHIMCKNTDYPIIDMKNVIMDLVRDHTSGKKWIYAENGWGYPVGQKFFEEHVKTGTPLENYHEAWASNLLFTDNSLGLFTWDAKFICPDINCLNTSLLDEKSNKKEPYYSFVAKIYTLIYENKNFFSTYHSKTNTDGIPVEDDLFTENDPKVLTRHIRDYLVIFSIGSSSVTFTNIGSKTLQEYANLENSLTISHSGNSVTVSNILENRTYVLKIVEPSTTTTTTTSTSITTTSSTTTITPTTTSSSTTTTSSTTSTSSIISTTSSSTITIPTTTQPTTTTISTTTSTTSTIPTTSITSTTTAPPLCPSGYNCWDECVDDLIPPDCFERTAGSTCDNPLDPGIEICCKSESISCPITTTSTTSSTTTSTTTTTIPTTIISTTTTIIPPQPTFNSTEFNTTNTTSGHNISLSFNNSLQENATVLFIITNEQGLVVDYFNITISEGMGSISKLVNCTSLGTGNYTISWEAYLESDNKLLNVKAWSKPIEWKKVSCK